MGDLRTLVHVKTLVRLQDADDTRRFGDVLEALWDVLGNRLRARGVTESDLGDEAVVLTAYFRHGGDMTKALREMEGLLRAQLSAEEYAALDAMATRAGGQLVRLLELLA